MDAYDIINKIGDGTFGTVYLCRKKDFCDKSGSSSEDFGTVAIKKMKKRFYNWEDCVRLREIKILKKLNHPNIVLLKEVIRENNHLYLVFEHMEENLYQMIRNQTDPLPEKTIRMIAIQIVRGVSYIHRQGFFHRDIKPENILCRNKSSCIKIADFGLVRELDSLPPYTEYISTRWYRAPELLLHSTNYNWTVDIWAVGCILTELYTLRPLFPGRTEADQIFKICQILGTPNMTNWPEGQRLSTLMQVSFPNLVALDLSDVLDSCPITGVSLIRSMLQWIPSERPKANLVLRDCYFKE